MLLDIIVAAVLLTQAARGFRAGIGAFALSLIGMCLGAAVALRFMPGLIASIPTIATSPTASAFMLALAVCFAALAGDALLGGLGRALRRKTSNQSFRFVDSALGAAAGVALAAVVIGVAATAVTPVLPTSATKAVSNSTLVPAISRALPPEVKRWSTGLTALIDASGFPQVFGGQEPDVPTAGGDEGITRTKAVQAAADSVLKIRADSSACGTAAEGSGWVAASHRVVTNAHVVAGANAVRVVDPSSGRELQAKVVSFDSSLDLAILAVADLTAAPLQRTGALSVGTATVVAGYPLDGPYRLDAARVAARINAVGSDIYGKAGVTRDIYAIRGTVQPGNSGGPLLTADGRVAGTVFARSTTTSTVGYVLTNAATKKLVDSAAADTTEASTAGCRAS